MSDPGSIPGGSIKIMRKTLSEQLRKDYMQLTSRRARKEFWRAFRTTMKSLYCNHIWERNDSVDNIDGVRCFWCTCQKCGYQKDIPEWMFEDMKVE